MDTTDSIRCYFFLNGQWTRFQAQDILLVLPNFFIQSEENKHFMEGKDQMDIMEIIGRVEKKLKGMLPADSVRLTNDRMYWPQMTILNLS